MTDSAPTAPIEIPAALMRELFGYARAAFPAECCGWLVGPAGGGRVTAARPCENAQDSGDHPTAADRGAETAYVIAGADLLAFNRGFATDTPPRIIYHSHPNGRAYFSDTDQQVATSPWGDGPAYDVQQLVVGIDGERVTEAALFAWSDAAGRFVEIARFPGEDVG
ncbi:Mov34/MPN/PAD-1 family protein [Haliangium sp.]|uniref:Mov34/MPN/PAD-1 family protein n=1 Tax=Haliangium sp. TaxID=2663208 RepID=UPI003D11C0FE